MAELAYAPSEVPWFDAAFGLRSPISSPGGATCGIFAPSEAPDEAMLAQLFDLAALAPSVGNCQPTRFVRVDDEARRALIRANFEAANREALMAYEGERAQATRGSSSGASATLRSMWRSIATKRPSRATASECHDAGDAP